MDIQLCTRHAVGLGHLNRHHLSFRPALPPPRRWWPASSPSSAPCNAPHGSFSALGLEARDLRGHLEHHPSLALLEKLSLLFIVNVFVYVCCMSLYRIYIYITICTYTTILYHHNTAVYMSFEGLLHIDELDETLHGVAHLELLRRRLFEARVLYGADIHPDLVPQHVRHPTAHFLGHNQWMLSHLEVKHKLVLANFN